MLAQNIILRLLIINTVIMKCILLCVFRIKKTLRKNILNMYTDTVKCIHNQRGVINMWEWGQY